MVRFPPNVEKILVEHDPDGTTIRLVVVRNDVRLEFPLRPDDARHLAGLLIGESPTNTEVSP